jgi:hypothetical protein
VPSRFRAFHASPSLTASALASALAVVFLLACAACAREPAAPANAPADGTAPPPSADDCKLLATRRETLARAAAVVVDARHQLEAACATKKTSPACAMAKAVVDDSADTAPTDATGLAALVGRMKTIHLSNAALSKPFAALLDAEIALTSAAQDLGSAPPPACR